MNAPQNPPNGTPSLDQLPPLAGYSDEPQPLGAYVVLMVIFNSAFTGGLYAAAKRGRLPTEVKAVDLLILGLATHKLARVLTKDAVTSALRAPFVRLKEKSGSSSIEETPRGKGMQRAVGELLCCPECTGHWVAAGLVLSTLHAPKVTRAITALYASLAIGDTFQFVYTGLKSRA